MHEVQINEWYTDDYDVEIIVDGKQLMHDGRYTFNCLQEILDALGVQAQIQCNVKVEKREVQTIKQKLVADDA